ncbi:MAG: hypothetical protein JXP34_15710 [Planctomycetes bacterium]|nr:hypothetical protein [Planctomycetota bacterium]
MRITLARGIAIALVAVTARAADAPALPADETFRPEALLPEGTILYASVPLSGPYLEKLRGTVLGKIGEDDEVLQFLEKPLERLQDDFEAWCKLTLERHQVNPREFLSRIPERAVLAVLEWNPERGEPSGLFGAIRLSGPEDDARTLIEKYLELAGDDKPARSQYEHAGVKVTRLVFRSKDAPPGAPEIEGARVHAVEFGFRGGWLLAIYDDGPEKDLQADLKRLLDSKGGLMSSAIYRKASGKVGYDGEDPFVYANGAKLIAIAREMARSAAEDDWNEEVPKQLDAILESLGISSLGALAYTQRIDGEGLRDEAFIEVPGPREGLLAALGSGGATGELARFFSGDAQVYIEAAIGVPAIWRAIRETVRAGGGEEGVKELEEGLADLEKTIGFSIEKDLIPCLGKRIAYGGTVGALPVGVGKTILVLEIADPKKLAEIIAKLRKVPAVEEGAIIVDGEHEGIETTSVTIRNVPIPLIPSFAIAGDHLLIAETPPTLLGMIDALKGNLPSLAKSASFAAHRAAAFDETAVFGGYYDIKGIAASVYGVLVPVLGMVTSTSPEARKIFQDAGIDFALLPSREAVVDPLFPGTDTMRIDREGISWSGTSPVGSPSLGSVKLGFAAGGGIGLSVGLHEMLEEERESVCREHLEKIRDAIAEYRATTGGGEPPRALIDLVRSGALEDPKVLLCPSDKRPQKVLDPATGKEIAVSYRYAPEAYQGDEKPPRKVVFEPDPERHRTGSNAVMSDGEVKKIYRWEEKQVP